MMDLVYTSIYCTIRSYDTAHILGLVTMCDDYHQDL